MSDAQQPLQYRQKRFALRNLKQTCETNQSLHNKDRKSQYLKKQPNKILEKLLAQIRVRKLRYILVQNLFKSNVYNERTDFSILSKTQQNQMRILQIEGVRLNQKILAIIYILQIIFVLVTFAISSFVAFLDGFRGLQYEGESLTLVLNALAIAFSFLKIITSIVSKKIKDGIPLIYITDIFEEYVKSFIIFIDLSYLIMLIILLLGGNNSGSFGVILFAMSVIKLVSSFQNFVVFQTTFIKGFKNQQYWKLFKIVLFNIGFAHFLASMLIAMSKLDPDSNWIVEKQISHQSWIIQYAWAFYFAATIMMTVGFGDISATNHKEAIVLSFVQLFSCIVLAYNISEIGSIISAIRTSQNQYQKRVSIFKRMAEEDQINIDLKTKIQGFLRQQRQIHQSYQFIQQQQLLNSIPQNLKNDYILQSNKKFFTYIPFFRNIQKSTLRKFNQFFAGHVYYPGQFVLSLKKASQSIMILKQGKVGLTYKKNGSALNGITVQSVQIAERQVHIGNGEFKKKNIPIILNSNFLNFSKKINYQVVAEAYSFVQTISYDDFLSTIKQSQLDSSYYFSILHRTSLSKNQWIQIECEKCSKQHKNNDQNTLSQSFNIQNKIQYHAKFDCPKLHYCPSRRIAILKNIRAKGQSQQGNQIFQRKRKRQNHCYKLEKTLYKPYQQKMRISARKKREDFVFKSSKTIQAGRNQNKAEELLKLGELRMDSAQQIQILQNLIKKSVAQLLAEQKKSLWEIQIDQLINYMNYFPSDNPRNFDQSPLYKINKADASSSQQIVSEKTKQKLKMFHFKNKSKEQFVQLQNTEQNQQKPLRYFKKIDISSDRIFTNEDLMRKTGTLQVFDYDSADEDVILQNENEAHQSEDSISSSKSTMKLNNKFTSGNQKKIKTQLVIGHEIKNQNRPPRQFHTKQKS